MCLGVSTQAMLWKTLATEPCTAFLGASPDVNHALWWLSVVFMVLVSAIYLLKVVFYFEAVRCDFHRPIRINFFAPWAWIACLFLVKGLPRPVWTIHHVVWFLLMASIFLLDLKVYGQWMSGGEPQLAVQGGVTSADYDDVELKGTEEEAGRRASSLRVRRPNSRVIGPCKPACVWSGWPMRQVPCLLNTGGVRQNGLG
uniref:Uncharacterized protein n=1 Tax=Oryza brachyantha TaxID=4533 RepID=J3MLI4_ORYBR